jgi:glycine oxidase
VTSAASKVRPDVLVVGGGAIGLAIADLLAGQGLATRLLEVDAVAAGASGAAAGMLAPVSEAEGDTPLLRLGLESLAEFASLCARLREETGIDPELEPSGLVHVAFSEAEHAALECKRQRLERAQREAGSEWTLALGLEALDASSLRTSGLRLGEGARSGLLSPREAHVRPPLLTRALAASARSRGASVETGVRVERLRIEAGRVLGVEASVGTIEAGTVVLAAGVWTPGLLPVDERARPPAAASPIEPVRGQILSLEGPLPPLGSILWAGGIYLVPKRDGRWVVGATEERVGFDRRVTAEGIAWLLERARRVFPETARATFGGAWAGLRPVSRDGLPWIGGWPGVEGLIVASGHGRNGVLLAPVTARLVADAVLGKPRADASARAVEPGRLLGA